MQGNTGSPTRNARQFAEFSGPGSDADLEPQSLLVSEFSGDECDSSDSGDMEHASRGSLLKKFGVHGLFVLAAAVSCVVSLVYMTGSPGSHLQKRYGANTRGIISAPEFSDLLKAQARVLLENAEDRKEAEMHLDKAIDDTQSFVKQHLSHEQQQQMMNVELGEQGWKDLIALCRALNDTRVKHVGHVMLEEVKTNILAGPAQVGKNVIERVGMENLKALVKDVLPADLRKRMAQRWKLKQKPSEDELWKLMLDPRGETFAKIRNQNVTMMQSGTDGSMSLSIQDRKLRSGKWNKPKLNGWELAEGITSVVFISAGEILLHVDLFTPPMALPLWAHALLTVPGYVLGVWSCTIGLSFWCDFFLGALGLNILDGIVIIAIDAEYQGTAPQLLGKWY